MKNMTMLSRAIVFLLAIGSALAATKKEAALPYVIAAEEVYGGGYISCVVVGKCEQWGTSICTDYYGYPLHEYVPQWGLCIPNVFGVYVSD